MSIGVLVGEMEVLIFGDDVGSVGNSGFMIVHPYVADDMLGILLDQAHLHDFPQLAGTGVSKRHAELVDQIQ